ncbi:uncharacterized protein LOC121863522 [Homarus americanus]|uniref:uncharacterized protein LOC121863522 n=1 Tax=Homarus americanus TaxID=6706 RepID=UPI001C4892A2|nr:uncharacterized protein LOC121863522 [Homarus americanus]
MKAWILAALLGVSLASVLPPMGVVRLQYSDPQTDDLIDLDVSINTVDDTVAFHMRGQYSMEDVDNLEDYRAGWGASKVLVDEACYLRKLNTSLNDTIGRLHELSSRGVQHMEGTLDISAIPAEDVEDWAGKRLRDFCGDYTMYQLVVSEGEETALAEEGTEERTFWLPFRRCYFFFFCFRCITITIIIPTGVTFFFFFG